MASDPDLWHYRAIGKPSKLGYKAFALGGDLFPVGPGTLLRVPFSWDGTSESSSGFAPVRSYSLGKGDGRFGAVLKFGWMLNYVHLQVIPDALDFLRTTEPELVELMESSEEAKKYIYLDTN